MASSLATASAVTKATTLPHSNDANFKHCPISNLSFPLSRKPSLRFVASKGLLQSRGTTTTAIRAQLNEVALDGSSNSAASPSTKSEAPAQEPKSASETLATEESISEFISQVASLVKLVDSRDIVELQLKQLDCELIIRKKEALPQPPQPPRVPVAANYAFPPPMSPPSPTLPPAPVPASSPAPAPAPVASPLAAKSSSSSLPPLKSPMAGTLYRSPGPGEPPFVKVGDKVQKGQVLCIIEAMKLMNEIEADQSGTIVEIVAEDGKPVSVDTPLFVIKP